MLITDLRVAVRTLRQSPTFTLIAVLSLALGIGASTSVSALTFALFLAPPAGVSQPESLVRICRLVNGRPEGHELSYVEYLYYRDHAMVFTELASDNNVRWLTDTESGYQLPTAIVSPSYFTVLGLRPRAGRFFVAGEDMAAGHHQVGRGQVYLVRLDPTLGSEIKKTRACVVVSPDELNEHLRTVIVAPMTTGGRAYPWRPRCRFQGRAGFVALDQLRTVDLERLVKVLGQLEDETVLAILERLQEMFAE